MSNGAGRKRTLGIAKESSYGTSASSPTYVLPLLEVARIEVIQNKAKNEASLGSTYKFNDVLNTTKQSKLKLKVKVDEDQLPIFLLQKYTISSTTHSGETAVYDHVATYNSNNDGTSYTLFLQDDDRGDFKVTGAKFDTMNFTADQDFFVVELDVQAQAIESWSGSNTVVAVKEFVGRHTTLKIDDFGGTQASYNILEAVINHSFGLSGDDTNFNLGDGELAQLFTTADEMSCEITALLADFSLRDDYTNNTAKEWSIVVQSTDRYVSGSVASTNPSITFAYPKGYVTEWAEDGGLDDILKQKITLTPVDAIGVSNTPEQITIVNAVASY